MKRAEDFEGIILQTDDKKKVVFTNNTFRSLNLSDQSELMNICFEVHTNQEPQRIQRYLNNQFFVFMVVPLIYSNGEPSGVALTGFPISFQIFKDIVLDNISDVVFYISIQNNNFYLKGANSIFFKNTGLKEADVLNKEIKDLLPKQHYEQFLTHYKMVSEEKKVVNLEVKTYFPSGEKYGNVLLAPICDDDECRAIIGVVHDITGIKLAEIELAKNYSILNEIVESSTDVIFIKDLNGRYILANSAVSKLLGISSLELIGKKDLEIFSEATASQFMTNDRQSLESGVMQYFEEECDINNKHYFFHSAKGPFRDEKGNIAGTIGISRDISKIKLAEQKLEHSNSMLKATLNATADGILVLDMNKRIVHYNRRFLTLWKISEDLLINNEYDQILRRVLDQLENPDECLERLEQLEKAPCLESYDLLKFKDGRFLERYTIPQMINGEVVGRVFSYRDLSQRESAQINMIDAERTKMEKLKYEITVHADPERVWETLISEESFATWSEPFSPDSQFIGKWGKGNKIKFIAHGKGGTVAEIRKFEPYKLIDAVHVATIDKDGNEEATGPMTEHWIGTRETYHLDKIKDETKLTVEMETHPDFKPMFENSWPEALKKVRELAEKRLSE